VLTLRLAVGGEAADVDEGEAVLHRDRVAERIAHLRSLDALVLRGTGERRRQPGGHRRGSGVRCRSRRASCLHVDVPAPTSRGVPVRGQSTAGPSRDPRQLVLPIETSRERCRCTPIADSGAPTRLSWDGMGGDETGWAWSSSMRRDQQARSQATRWCSAKRSPEVATIETS
jgi:hypothetical protein